MQICRATLNLGRYESRQATVPEDTLLRKVMRQEATGRVPGDIQTRIREFAAALNSHHGDEFARDHTLKTRVSAMLCRSLLPRPRRPGRPGFGNVRVGASVGRSCVWSEPDLASFGRALGNLRFRLGNWKQLSVRPCGVGNGGVVLTGGPTRNHFEPADRIHDAVKPISAVSRVCLANLHGPGTRVGLDMLLGAPMAVTS